METTLSAFREALYGPGYDPASFHQSTMVGTELKTASLSTPHVKAVIKAFANSPTLPLGDFPLDETVELTVCFFALSLKKEGTFEKQMQFLQRYLRFANSWMITDALPQILHRPSGEIYLPYYRKFVSSRYEYERRFAYVYALGYYRESSIEPFLEGLRYDEHYYVYMAEAWMIANFGIVHFEDVVAFLRRPGLPISLKRKAISKMRDSYRISQAQKDLLKEIRDEI